MDIKIQMLQPTPANYCKFGNSLKNILRKNFPSGFPANCITISRDYDKTLLRT